MKNGAVVEHPVLIPTLDQMRELERYIKDEGLHVDPALFTFHKFCPGLYVREIYVPAGFVVVGKMHTGYSFFMIVQGEATVWTTMGMKRVKAPFLTVTGPGDKRVGYAHENTIAISFYANPDNEDDLEVLEARYTVDETRQVTEEDLKFLGELS